MAEETQNKIVPYIPRTCASLLLPKPNSEVVPISTTVVFAMTETFSPTPNFFVAANFAFFALLKKYVRFL